MNDTELLHYLTERECCLHQSRVRHDPQQLDALLHPLFREISRSGGVFSREEVIHALLAEPITPALTATGFSLERLSPVLAMLTYLSHQTQADGQRSHSAHRTSLWCKTDEGWQLRFHQGTTMILG